MKPTGTRHVLFAARRLRHPDPPRMQPDPLARHRGSALMTPTIAVLGAGLMGRLLALALAKAGYHVEVFERGGPDASQSAAFVAAAMLAPLAESVEVEALMWRWARRASIAGRNCWPACPSRCFSSRTAPCCLAHAGSRSGGPVRAASASTGRSAAGERRVREVPGAEIAALEPSLGQRFARGIFLPREGPTRQPRPACRAGRGAGRGRGHAALAYRAAPGSGAGRLGHRLPGPGGETGLAGRARGARRGGAGACAGRAADPPDSAPASPLPDLYRAQA